LVLSSFEILKSHGYKIKIDGKNIEVSEFNEGGSSVTGKLEWVGIPL
jgi:hypothetical protein